MTHSHAHHIAAKLADVSLAIAIGAMVLIMIFCPTVRFSVHESDRRVLYDAQSFALVALLSIMAIAFLVLTGSAISGCFL